MDTLDHIKPELFLESKMMKLRLLYCKLPRECLKCYGVVYKQHTLLCFLGTVEFDIWEQN